jgi:hypothetical protein
MKFLITEKPIAGFGAYAAISDLGLHIDAEYDAGRLSIVVSPKM